MINGKKIPTCPYCGTAMQCDSEEYITGGGYAMYGCHKCRSTSPIKEDGASLDKAVSDAYVAAMQRREEPNRVLFLAEVVENCNADEWEFVWLEEKKMPYKHINQHCGIYADEKAKTITFCYPHTVSETRMPMSDYNREWRCWLYKPTMREAAKTPWEES